MRTITLLLASLVILLSGCNWIHEEESGLQQQECYAAADGGIECYPA